MHETYRILCAVFLLVGCTAAMAYPVMAVEINQPDLIITGVTSPSSGVPGGKVTLSATVKNTGSAYSSYSYTYFYLSRDAVLDSLDSYVGMGYISSLSPGSSKTVYYSALIPSGSSGAYRIIAKADGTGRISEKDETNNVGSGSLMTTGPAVPTTIPTTVPTNAPAPGSTPSPTPDLVIAGITVPPSAIPGGKVALSATVKNEGDASASYSYTYFYLSTDTARDSRDTYLGRVYVSSISAGTSRSVSFSATIPAGTSGPIYIISIADGTGRIGEKNEGNNAGFSLPITVQAGSTPIPTQTPTITLKPDLIALSVAGPDTGSSGGSISVQLSVKNGGTAQSGNTGAALYLSPDISITQADTSIGLLSVPSISAGASVTVNGNVAIPTTVPAGTYYLGTIIDQANKVSETDEANNVAFDSVPVKITQSVPGGSVEAQVEAAILKYTNQERTVAGRAPLSQNSLLTSIARAHSLDMKTRNFFSHTNPDGLSPFQRMTAAGYDYSAAAENIAATSSFTLSSNPDEVGRYFVQEMWMKSTGHRENILSTSYTEIGIGVVYESDRSSSPYGFIATQNFGRPR